VSETTLRQYFGPSARHARACVELAFPASATTRRLAPLEPLVLAAGFKLSDALPGEPLQLDEAVARLAVALLSRHARWWSSHGSEEAGGWAALGHPYPHVAAVALTCAHDLLRDNGVLAPGQAARLHGLSTWLERISKIKMWMLAAAEICGSDATIVSETADIHQVGRGAKGVHMCRAGTQRDSLTGVKLERSKQTTVETLQKLGLPTTTGLLASTTQQAVQAARKLGLPCVIKPLQLSRGTGVAAGLASEAEVAAAADAALALMDRPVRVEQHVAGDAHRLLVGAGQLLWVYRKRAARVTGDGKASIAALIERENQRRSTSRDQSEVQLVKIVQDEALRRFVASRYGLTVDAVPSTGTSIVVSGQANTASGGTIEDMMGVTHPDNRALALRVARLFRMEVIGIDFMTPDISRSWKDVPSAIIEVNRMPSMNAIGDATLLQRTLFPNRLSTAIPIVAVIGDVAYRTELADRLRAAFGHHGLRFATADFRTRHLPANNVMPTAGAPVVEALLLDPEADAGAVLCDAARVERDGLPLRRCDLLIRQDKTPLPWLENLADTVLRGPVSQARIDLIAARLARRYGDRSEGGPLPALEPIDSAGGAFGLKVWRTRGMPRAWFWDQVGTEAPRTDGLTTHEDLLDAVVTLARAALGKSPKLAGRFTHGDVPSGWAFVNVDATLPLPAQRREEARTALLAAIERVNAVAAAKIP
jgi:D-alanine-D-alanine ligase-like ATP-grasp enzyme